MNDVDPEEWPADSLEKIADTKTRQLSSLHPNNWKNS
jgi:hypothetical protein